MTLNPQKRLLVFTAMATLVSLTGCSGSISAPSVGEQFPGAAGVTPVSATAQPTEDLPTPTPTEAPPQWGDSVTWAALDPYAESGLELSQGGDFDVEAVQVGQQQFAAYRTGNRLILPSLDGNFIRDSYMQFRVDDAFLYGGNPTPHIRLNVEYLDIGSDTFFIEYDGELGGPFNDGRFTETSYQTKANSGEVRTAVFVMHDAHFANRDNGGDFRINDAADGAETILRVTISRFMPEMDPATQIAVDFYDDGDQLTIGQCTTLHWVVGNAADVSLNGNPVDDRGFEFTCPQSTTTYTLVAANAAGQVRRELTVSVSPPSSTSSPTYDLAASCWHSYECWTEAYCRFFRVLSSRESTGTSSPIVVELYVGAPGYLSLVQSTTVSPLEPGQGVTFYYGGLVQCCQIILRNNYDLLSTNDSSISCR
jgi:hypothetical protein